MYQSYSKLPSFCFKAIFETQCKIIYTFVPKRWAGHSKWANIKHTKMSRDINRSILFQRISHKITLATKEGGENPDINSKLKIALAEAKKANMPNTTIQHAIKNAKTSTLAKPYWITYSNSLGLIVAFEVVTDSSAKAISALNKYCKRISLKPEKRGSDFYVERGIIIGKPSDSENNYEKAVEDAIHAGIEEVTEGDNNTFIFECPPGHIEASSKKLEQMGYNIQSVKNEIEFNNYIKLDKNQTQIIYNVFQKLQENFEDLTRIEDNISDDNDE